MATTAVASRSVTDLTAVKAYLSIDGSTHDELLQTLLTQAKQEADAYCNNSFLSAAGGNADIPLAVETWIKRRVYHLFEQRPLGVTSASIPFVGTTLWNMSRDIMFFDLKPYRIEPGFGGW